MCSDFNKNEAESTYKFIRTITAVHLNRNNMILSKIDIAGFKFNKISTDLARPEPVQYFQL